MATSMSTTPQPIASRYKNRMLAFLPDEEMRNLAQHLSPEGFPVRKNLNSENTGLCYFLEDGMASIVVEDPKGSVEVGIVGVDGVVGLSALLGVGSTPLNTFIQIAGSGYSIQADILKEAFEAGGALRDYVQRYIHSLLIMSSQNAACNRLHGITARLSRWILTCHDRLRTPTMPLTHEFLSNMLGTPRATVSLAAGQLQKAGIIEYTRGQVVINDQAKLEQTSCRCYAVVRDEYRRLQLL